jgi:hypothetical protein
VRKYAQVLQRLLVLRLEIAKERHYYMRATSNKVRKIHLDKLTELLREQGELQAQAKAMSVSILIGRSNDET